MRLPRGQRRHREPPTSQLRPRRLSLQPPPQSTARPPSAQMLTAFPQYSGVSDTYGNVGNFSYHSLQVVLNQRMHNGLTFNVNYTYSKNLGDDGHLPQRLRPSFRRHLRRDQNLQAGQDRPFMDGTLHPPHHPCLRRLPTAFRQGQDRRRFHAGPCYCRRMAVLRHLHFFLWHAACRHLVRFYRHYLPGQGQAMPDMASGFSGPLRINGKIRLRSQRLQHLQPGH